jgi:hypothetical protein
VRFSAMVQTRIVTFENPQSLATAEAVSSACQPTTSGDATHERGSGVAPGRARRDPIAYAAAFAAAYSHYSGPYRAVVRARESS